jgi:type II secretory ATPase GspE/PulE/Tfp pilus assembly ATPase PilB-like protein
MEIGLEPFLVGASVIGVLAQRLMRRVCPHCKTEDKPSQALLRRLESQTGLDLSNAKFQRGKGCKECRGYGYRGRTGIFELLEVENKLRELITRPATTAELRAAAIDAGMTTMLRDGIEKAAQGVTTVEEVLRVLAGLPKGVEPTE